MSLFTDQERHHIRRTVQALSHQLAGLSDISTTDADDDVREWAGKLHDGMCQVITLLRSIDAATAPLVLPNAAVTTTPTTTPMCQPGRWEEFWDAGADIRAMIPDD